MNIGAPKLRSLSPSIKLYEDNTVAVNLIENVIICPGPPHIVSDKPLEPCELFLIEIENVDKKLSIYYPPVRCSIINHENLPMLNESYVMFDNSREVGNDRSEIFRELTNFKELVWTPYGSILLSILYRYLPINHMEQELPSLDTLVGDRIGFCYFQSPNGRQHVMYKVSKYGIYVQNFILSNGGPKYLLIQMLRQLKQFRTIPVYAVPSLQGLSREVIFKRIRAEGKLTKERLEELNLPRSIINKLQIHIGWNFTVGVVQEDCLDDLHLPKPTKALKTYKFQLLKYM
ncbi:PREDICTED: uncharacterized protein LOC106745995 [Dinoponera quadriceps]|uniref:Uncharacterized protein LOC106745995 n=1 Tax=Dinoponera quadriceps TaxID=609295 RepID=A0A6P3XGL1_DINQU|nr:PREDICTED: uncharacterized protein LOC106745995 [Dinoponera quadriceps]